MDWYWDTYSAGAATAPTRALSPLCADDLSGLAPALVTTAAFDPLRDEGEAYAAALRAAGVPVVLRRAAGLVHGYLSMTGIHRASLRRVARRRGCTRRAARRRLSTVCSPELRRQRLGRRNR